MSVVDDDDQVIVETLQLDEQAARKGIPDRRPARTDEVGDPYIEVRCDRSDRFAQRSSEDPGVVVRRRDPNAAYGHLESRHPVPHEDGLARAGRRHDKAHPARRY